ncbi:MAG: AAA family ATPase [Gemmatimonadaceae bacterium]|nr:AAA family ATPase [Gemmatimonadaceae bacterium]
MPNPDISEILRRVDAAGDGSAPSASIATGFPSLDKTLGGGLRPGDLAFLGGDVGSGKSALALAVALRATAIGSSAIFLSGEMAPDRLLERVLAIEGRAAIDDIRNGSIDDTARASLGAAAHRLRDQMPALDRIPFGGVSEVGIMLRSTPDLQLAVVDSLQSVTKKGSSQEEELAVAVKELKMLAIDASLAILVTTHVHQQLRGRSDPRPTLDDFGALGSVKQHADVVLGLYRAEMYDPGWGAQGGAELILLKNRNGPISYIDLFFHQRWLRFEDVMDP